MKICRWEELTGTEVYEILKARAAVFMLEQQIHYLDMDDVDYRAVHLFEQGEDGCVDAYLRMFEEDAETARIGRVLTRERGKGFGKRMIEVIGEYADRDGYRRIACDAQVTSVGFYEKCGFLSVSKPFMEAGIPHVRMERELT